MDLKSFFNSQKWTFSKTYAQKAPHEYLLKDKASGDKKLFEEAARTILDDGMTIFFWGHPNKYIYIDGKFYWVMHPIPEECILINRCDASLYDLVFMNKRSANATDLQRE